MSSGGRTRYSESDSFRASSYSSPRRTYAASTYTPSKRAATPYVSQRAAYTSPRTRPLTSFSPLRMKSPGSSIRTPRRYLSPTRLDNDMEGNKSMGGYSTPEKKSSPIITRNVEKVSPLRGDEEDVFARSLKEFIDISKQLEDIKQELSLRADFTLLDAFRVFDVEGRGEITAGELEEGMNLYNVFPSKDQVYLFMRRYDKESLGRIRFSDFCEAFMPKQREYADMLDSRTPTDVSKPLDREFVFTPETKVKFIRGLKLHIEVEDQGEYIRQRLSKRPLFNLLDAFDALDKESKGFVTAKEFRDILEDHNFLTTEKDVNFLVDRFDKDKDGRVTYSEFVQEITPKSPKAF